MSNYNIIDYNSLSIVELGEYVCERDYINSKFFGNVDPAYLRKIWFITPDGNDCVCWINHKPGKQMGSMVITSVNNVKGFQYIQGMCKLEYYDKYLDRLEDSNYYFLTEKLDGSNICVYKLKDNVTGEVLEYVPKSRRLPILEDNLQNLYNKVVTEDMFQILKDNDCVGSLCFELYGKDNPHMIQYEDNDLGLCLISVYSVDGELLNLLNYKSYSVECAKPIGLSCVDYYNFNGTRYNKDSMDGEKEFLVLVEELMEDMNRDCLKIEGCVLNVKFNNGWRQLKIKPKSIRDYNPQNDHVNKSSVCKEVSKMFDELPLTVINDLKETDTDFIINYVCNGLYEDYSKDLVDSKITRDKILNEVVRRLTKNYDLNLYNIASSMVEEYPDYSVTELIRVFSSNYPLLRSKANLMFNYIKQLKEN